MRTQALYHISAFLLVLLLAPFSNSATAANRTRAPAELYRPMGGSGPLLGGGNGHVYDASSLDSNPAGLALNQFRPGYFLGGETFWIDRNILASEASVVDSASAEVAAGLKMRRTTFATGAVVDRYSLGAAERIGETPVILGLAGDMELFKDPQRKVDKERNWRARMGLLYQPSGDLYIGLKSDGYLDSAKAPLQHAVGFSWNIQDYAFLNGDAFFSESSLERYTAGLTINAKTWLDLVVGYGYEIETQRHGAAAGFSVRSEKFKLYYYLTRPDFSDSVLEQSFGAEINLLALDKG